MTDLWIRIPVSRPPYLALAAAAPGGQPDPLLSRSDGRLEV